MRKYLGMVADEETVVGHCYPLKGLGCEKVLVLALGRTEP